MDVLDAPIIKGKTAQQTFEKFWEQASNDAKSAGDKEPLLITRKDRRQACIAMRKAFYDRVKDSCGEHANGMIVLHMADEIIVILKLNDFLNWAKPEMFMSVTRARRK